MGQIFPGGLSSQAVSQLGHLFLIRISDQLEGLEKYLEVQIILVYHILDVFLLPSRVNPRLCTQR